MENKQISQLQEAANVRDGSYAVIEDGLSTKKITVSNLMEKCVESHNLQNLLLNYAFKNGSNISDKKPF